MSFISAFLNPTNTLPLSFFAKCYRHLMALEEAIPADDPDLPAVAARGHIFSDAQGIITATVRGMADHPDLFDSDRTAALGLRSARAFGWFCLHTTLQRLANRARAHFQREQIAATREALAILRSAREIARQSGASRSDRLRLDALSYAQVLVQKWQLHTTGHRR